MCARGRLSPAKLTRHSETDLASGSRPGWPGSPIAVLAGRLGCRSDWLAPPPFFLLTPRPRSLVPLSYPHNAGGSVPGTERTYDVGSARPENDTRDHRLRHTHSGDGNLAMGIPWESPGTERGRLGPLAPTSHPSSPAQTRFRPSQKTTGGHFLNRVSQVRVLPGARYFRGAILQGRPPRNSQAVLEQNIRSFS